MQDVTIIGAGPAGSIAAIMLARGGWDVTLIEQHRFPRDKVCGECVSAMGIDVLERLHLASAIRELSPAMLNSNALVAPSGAQTVIPLPLPMWGVSRSAMDATLLIEARRAGAHILQPARVERLERGVVTVRDLITNVVRHIRPGRIILADGKAALGRERPPPTGDFGVKAHFTGVADRTGTIALFGVEGHYVGLAPIEGGRWNLAMSVPENRLRAFGGRLDALFEQCMSENAGLARRFRTAARVSDWLVAPLPRFPLRFPEPTPARPVSPTGIIAIGNAAAALEPIGGEGMGLAMRSAELAAGALLARGEVSDLPRNFARLWRVRRGSCRLVARLMSRPDIADNIVALAGSNQRLGRIVMACMGKA
ncbi:MAG: FAD-dependent oxidoreductase [Tepidisphaeraceae bacterium]